MFSKNTKSKDLDRDQRELFEHAQDRIKQKKRLTQHFVIFLAGSILLIVINVVLGYGKDVKLFGADWFVWAILLWTFFFLVHALNVVITNKFMGKDWEQKQMDKLVEKQKKKIEEMRQKVAVDMPVPEKKSNLQKQRPTDPNLPLNS